MTPVGHSLTGIAIAALASSPRWTKMQWAVAIPAFVVCANAPDLPFPTWGHDRYEVSHSLFVTGLGTMILFAVHFIASKLISSYRISVRTVAAACIAWFSHIFLDSLYGHGKGIAVMWPFGTGRLNFPIPWFETLRMPIDWFTAHSAKIFAIELVCYAPIAIVCLVFAFRCRRDLRL